MNFKGRDLITVEVCLSGSVRSLPNAEIRAALVDKIKYYIKTHFLAFNKTITIPKEEEMNEVLENQTVKSLFLDCDCKNFHNIDPFDYAMINYNLLQFTFHKSHCRPMEVENFLGAGDNDAEEENVPSSNHWLLPSDTFQDLWENLIYDDHLKEKLLKFALSALVFGKLQVNQNIVNCNRLILLHGPPGTGKTSLCKALAQKISIRTGDFFKHTHLIEINSHSLFSKWFSESGKLVMRLFGRIREMLADPGNLVCVLIDEVESLAYARDSMSGQEPKDAIRVVNALLTQLDSIREYTNVLILATSNLAKTIDLAFLDRADIKEYIGLPTVPAINNIYESIFTELMNVGIIKTESLEDANDGILKLAENSYGLNGRTLRKLPFLAHALYTNHLTGAELKKIKLTDFLNAMQSALKKYKNDKLCLNNENNREEEEPSQ